MVNINSIKKKSIGIIRTLVQKLEDMKLKHYYFECAIIYFNAILRGSILYASETYYNLTEKNLRNIERIEEMFLRKILKTSKGCPISQLYLETGQWPARFQIMKSRMLFLKYILGEEETSMVAKFFKLQLKYPIKGDWVSTCRKDLKEMKIELTLNEIRTMPKESFSKLIKSKISEISLKYLLKKRNSKGKEITYERLEMADYLMPFNKSLSIEDKRNLFSMRNRMVEIGNNFGRNEKCKMCDSNQDMKHIYLCEYLNEQQIRIPYVKIYEGNIFEQTTVLRIFEKNMKKLNEEKSKKNQSPGDPFCDPLNSGMFSIG